MTDGYREQRGFERFCSDMPIWIRVPNDQASEYQLVETANISAGGLLFEVDYQLQVGERLNVQFELPQSTDLIKAIGVVRHTVEKDGSFLTGVQFETVENRTVAALMAYLEALFK